MEPILIEVPNKKLYHIEKCGRYRYVNWNTVKRMRRNATRTKKLNRSRDNIRIINEALIDE